MSNAHPKLIETFLGGRVMVKTGDITLEKVDAIVNAANKTLYGGKGVDGAIHLKGGTGILKACREIRETQYPDGLPTGEAVITGAGKLYARFVIHTVGPIYGAENGNESQLLSACYANSLKVADANSLKSIAFPAISTGAYGYPKAEAAKISSAAVSRFLAADTDIDSVSFVFFSLSHAELFLEHHLL